MNLKLKAINLQWVKWLGLNMVFCQKSWNGVQRDWNGAQVSRNGKRKRSSCRSCLLWVSEWVLLRYELLLSRTSQELQARRTICFVISIKKPQTWLRGRCVKCCQMPRSRRRWEVGRGGGYSGVFMHTRALANANSLQNGSQGDFGPREGGALKTY